MISPERIKLFQPGKQRLVDRLGMGTRQGLEEMVMGVDEARENDMSPRVEDFVTGQARSVPADELDDLPGLDDEPARATFGQHCDGITYPDSHASSLTIHEYGAHFWLKRCAVRAGLTALDGKCILRITTCLGGDGCAVAVVRLLR